MARGRALSQAQAANPPPYPLVALLGLAGLAIAVVILGPMLLPGFPLRFDLVSVPRPVLGADALGLGDRLPRAVPLDAATAVLARVLPDALLTQLLGALALTLAGTGAALLTPAPLPGRLLALMVAEWNPFVLEQLSIGHLPHLFAYGALPWVAICGRNLARGWSGGDGADGGLVRDWAGLTVAAGFGSLTPGGGVLCLITALAALAAGWSGGTAGRGRRALAGVVSLAVLQLPWLVAGLTVAATAASSATEVDAEIAAFALRPETGWGRLVDAAGLAGMWNAAALPASRATVLARVSTVLLLALAAAGLPALRRHWTSHRAELLAAALAAAAGYLLAVLAVLPGGKRLLATMIETVPGAALLRDGHRWLALPALALAVLAGLGIGELAGLARRCGARKPPHAAIALLAGLLVIASMPDAAGGLGGRLRARHYPPEWAQARAVLDASPDRARILVLPWTAFRRFDWSGPDPVLDPAPRLLPRQSISSAALLVSGRRLPEEGAVGRSVAAALAPGGEGLDAARLRSLAIGWVLIERGTPGPVPELPAGWRTVLQGPRLSLVRSPGPLPAAPRPASARAVAVVGAQLVAGLAQLVAGLAAGLLLLVRRRRKAGVGGSPER